MEANVRECGSDGRNLVAQQDELGVRRRLLDERTAAPEIAEVEKRRAAEDRIVPVIAAPDMDESAGTRGQRLKKRSRRGEMLFLEPKGDAAHKGGILEIARFHIEKLREDTARAHQRSAMAGVALAFDREHAFRLADAADEAEPHRRAAEPPGPEHEAQAPFLDVADLDAVPDEAPEQVFHACGEKPVAGLQQAVEECRLEQLVAEPAVAGKKRICPGTWGRQSAASIRGRMSSTFIGWT